MKSLRLLTVLILVIISCGIYSQKNIKIKLKINLIPIENRYGNLKNCSIKIYRNNVELQNFKLKGNRVKKIITTSVDKSKLDNLFEKNLNETKAELKKINL